MKKSVRLYYLKHKAEIAAYQKKYRQEHKMEASEYQRKWTAKNYKRKLEINKKFDQSDKGHASDARSNHKIRAKKFGHNINANLTLTEWHGILKNQNHNCNFCRKPFNETNKPTRDCIVPIAEGGHLVLSNVQALCLRCNSIRENQLKRSAK